MPDLEFSFKLGEDTGYKLDAEPDLDFDVKMDVIPVGLPPTGTTEITINQNGVSTHDVTNYASAEITVNVPGYTLRDMANKMTVTDTHLDLGDITWVMPYAYYNCDTLESVYAPEVTSFGTGLSGGNVGQYVFYSCSNLESIYFPKLTSVGGGGYQFAYCSKLATINVPFACGQHIFEYCSGLQTAVVRGTGQWNSYGFRSCTNLEIVDAKCSALATYEFSGCSKLKTLILRRTASATTASNINAFNGTPFASGGTGGTLYVPSALIDTYKAAARWTTLFGDSRAEGYANNQILPIEGSIYETKYADGSDI